MKTINKLFGLLLLMGTVFGLLIVVSTNTMSFVVREPFKIYYTSCQGDPSICGNNTVSLKNNDLILISGYPGDKSKLCFRIYNDAQSDFGYTMNLTMPSEIRSVNGCARGIVNSRSFSDCNIKFQIERNATGGRYLGKLSLVRT